MKQEYDFSQGKRGTIGKTPPGKTRITIRLDDDIIEWFRERVHAIGGGNYQTLINNALRLYIQQRQEPLEETLRRLLRQKLQNLTREQLKLMFGGRSQHHHALMDKPQPPNC